MTTVTVSSKFQVVMPREIREAMNIAPGQQIQVLVAQNRIVLIPVQPMRNLKGFLKGIDTEVARDEDRL